MNKDNIKPAEVSEVLLAELQGIDLKAQYAEVGTTLQVSDGVVRIYGLGNAEANELLEFENGMKAVVMNLEEDNVGAVLLGPTDLVKEGDTVRRTAIRPRSVSARRCSDVSSRRWASRSTARGRSRAGRSRCRSNARLRA